MGVIVALRSLVRPTVAPSPPPGLTLVRFKRKYVSPTGFYTVGEVAGFPVATALDRIEAGMAKKVSTPPPPHREPQSAPLVPVRLTTSHTRDGRSYSRGEVIGVDRETATELINQGLAVPPDAPLPPPPPIARIPGPHDLPAEITDAITVEGVWMPDVMPTGRR